MVEIIDGAYGKALSSTRPFYKHDQILVEEPVIWVQWADSRRVTPLCSLCGVFMGSLGSLEDFVKNTPITACGPVACPRGCTQPHEENTMVDGFEAMVMQWYTRDHGLDYSKFSHGVPLDEDEIAAARCLASALDKPFAEVCDVWSMLRQCCFEFEVENPLAEELRAAWRLTKKYPAWLGENADAVYLAYKQHRPEAEPELIPPADGIAFYLMGARLNHACTPHAWPKYVASVAPTVPRSRFPQLVLTADCLISFGEQIFISYLDAEELTLPTEDRRRVLQERYLFTCQCARCGTLPMTLNGE